MRTYPCGNAGLGPPAAAELETPWKGLKQLDLAIGDADLHRSRTRNSLEGIETAAMRAGKHVHAYTQQNSKLPGRD